MPDTILDAMPDIAQAAATRPQPSQALFDAFFQGEVRTWLVRAIEFALAEDGPDLTSNAVFGPEDFTPAAIVAKERLVVAGLPVAELVLEAVEPGGDWMVEHLVSDGDLVEPGTIVLKLCGRARTLLKAERVILNLVCRLSGIASLTRRYVEALAGSATRLLDTRKTAPCLRYPDKYAVLCGGGSNHRMNLSDMLLLKDTHIDQAGSITKAVEAMRAAYAPCPPIEVECRNQAEVDEAVACSLDRIMLDNMDDDGLRAALARIPDSIATEVSGGVGLDSIARLAQLGPDFISVGRLTHSAPTADLSMRIIKPDATD